MATVEELNAEIRRLTSRLKVAEDTLAEIDFDVFGMEQDCIKLRAENELLKSEYADLKNSVDYMCL